MKFAMVVPCIAMALAASAQAQNLQDTLARLDAASARFTSAEAKVHREAYNAFIKDVDDVQEGTAYFKRDPGAKVEMGLLIPGKNTIAYKNGTLLDYEARMNCTRTITRPGIDTYLTLGFGGSGKDLAAKWDIADLGPDTINGTKVEKLELTPKDDNVKKNVAKVSLWMDLDRDVSLKQVFLSPTKDTNTAIYSEIKLNKPVDAKPYAIKSNGKACGG